MSDAPGAAEPADGARQPSEPAPPEPGSGAGRLALMLAGGGARAAYQAGVLSGIAHRRPDLRIPVLTGVSAGAINLGYLAAHPGPFGETAEGLARKWRSLTTEEVFRSGPLSMLWIVARWAAALLSGGTRLAPSARGLVDTAPLREFLARSIHSEAIADNVRSGRLEAIALAALSYQTGRTVTFVQAAHPVSRRGSGVHHRVVRARLSIDHIMASAAIPLLFPAVKVGQQWYGDGSFRHTAPLAPAIRLGADRILAVSARYPRSEPEARRMEVPGYPPPARILGLLFNSVFLDTLDWDAARLRRLNALLAALPPERREETGLRRIELLILRPSQDIGRLAADYERRLPRTLRFFVRGLGSPRARSADFVSYLLFESAYISRLIELGEEDAERQWPEIEAFLEAPTALPIGKASP